MSWQWQDDAACRGRDLVLFFGPDFEKAAEREIREEKARAVCAGCRVRADCLGYALSRPERYGWWAVSEDERADERKRRGRGRGPRRSGDGERVA